MSKAIENPNPTLVQSNQKFNYIDYDKRKKEELDLNQDDEIDALESILFLKNNFFNFFLLVFDIIKHIQDPELPYTLE